MNECTSVADMLRMIGVGALGTLLSVLGLIALIWKAADIWKFFKGYTLEVVERAKPDKAAAEGSGGGMKGAVITLSFLVVMMAIAIIYLANMP